MKAIPKGLAPRLILALTILVAVISGISGYINLHIQEQQLLDEMVLGADQLSRSITSATWHTMLANQSDATYQIMETIGKEHGIESIRIFNKEGHVTFSTDPRASSQVDKNAEACFLCHAKEEPLVRIDRPSRSRIIQGSDGRRRMAMITPIYNEPSCSNAACHAHPEEKTVLGVLDITMDLERVEREVAGIKLRTLLITLIQIVLIAVMTALFTRHFVGRPIRELIGGARAVSVMELDEPIVVKAGGELHELADSFNVMRERLKVALGELHEFTQHLEHKVEERSQQLIEARQKLIQSDRMASLGQLAASVAHEINNPLSGVLNLSMLMQRILTNDGLPSERVEDFRRYLSSVSNETARVGRIVSDLLSFSRRSKPQTADADLNEIVGQTISLISHKLELAGIHLDLWLDPNLPKIHCDRSQMQQVVINLVMNAAEAMVEGGRVIARTRLDPGQESTVLEVEDSGTGIPDEILSRIYDPFFTTKEEGKGVGLGLAVVYGIVEAHGGTIEVKSKVNEGTTFTVKLPIHGESKDIETEFKGTITTRFKA
ncbi:MAG: HAMP domain-containing protein [Candidatus Eisenbacteria sp.]|nr:HAMP domain-containing protein [Candidatus Eisenbacteria bacterium]